MKRVDWFFRIALFICLLYLGSGAYIQWELVKLSQTPIPEHLADSPVEFDGEIFADPISKELAVAEKERDELYRWAVLLQPWQAIGLMAIACGGGGGFLREVVVAVQHPGKTRLNWMYLGLLMGPAILLGILGIGEVLFEGETLRTWSVVAFTFFGGCFSEESFDFLQNVYAEMRERVLK